MKPTQTYLINELGKLGPTKVLDFGCSKGSLWNVLPPNADVWGCDVQMHPEMEVAVKGREDRFRLSTDPKKIPYEDSTFDIVFSNSVFEHVGPLEEIVAECARVLKPGGRLIAIFPTASTIIEPHVFVPFAHWLPAGALRRSWCAAFFAIKQNSFVKRHGRLSAAHADEYLKNQTSYRPYTYCMELLGRYFEWRSISVEISKIKGEKRIPDWALSRFYSVAVDAVRRG